MYKITIIKSPSKIPCLHNEYVSRTIWTWFDIDVFGEIIFVWLYYTFMYIYQHFNQFNTCMSFFMINDQTSKDDTAFSSSILEILWSMFWKQLMSLYLTLWNSLHIVYNLWLLNNRIRIQDSWEICIVAGK